MSKRMAYGRCDSNPISEKLRKRMEDLKEMHDEGLIDLRRGPWDYYGAAIGDPKAFVGKNIKDYMQSCLTT